MDTSLLEISNEQIPTNLETYDESVILHGESFDHGCLNCHTFLNNRPESMTIGIRSDAYGGAVVLARDGELDKIGTKFGYSAWHPTGRLIIYSINHVRDYFHTARAEIRDVWDSDSALCYYMTDTKTVKTAT